MTGAGAGMVMAGTMPDRTSSAVVLNADWDELVAAIDQWSLLLNDGLSLACITAREGGRS